MQNSHTKLPTENRIKQRAKKLKKELNISHSEALDQISAEYGFSSWFQLQEKLKKNKQAKTPTPAPSLKFIEDNDVEMTSDDYKLVDQERTVDLPIPIKHLISDNQKQLINIGVEYSLFEPTVTGLKKSILDATHTVRVHFELENFHFYWEQKQGPDYKVIKDAYFLTDTSITKSKLSLYRPVTKQGDPRMWFRKLPEFCLPGDQIAIIVNNDIAYLLNISKIDLKKSLNNEYSHIKKFLTEYEKQSNSVAEELLHKLKKLAQTPFAAMRKGDTAIGYTLEAKLGIDANSSKQPDYHGIEIKSGRGVKTRTTLFAQVADWNISPCKRSAEILNKYGYERDNDFKLYCTVSTQKENPQGLSFIYDQTKDELQEWHNKTDLVAIWPGDLLRSRLKEKHSETFWVEAKSEIINGIEHFHLVSVTHTKSPIVSQLLPLINSGVITMDHLIKKSGKTNRVSEKGPLFKINKRDLELLFPTPIKYLLTN
ncbi:hypothetical protein GNP80_04490 [Aliivibrio fischeri]|uniref:MvaI/BcnI family restriction endonuclease n=1 Tax=Aliivibrio fischeri TaxID=668 RepID=UPI0012D8A6D3|nr:MvaI/BcnI family restriction endonuclease [Aliivibrio fischeri]MUJ21376.1 hypothetical protein [Aliivibrio fischeri]MUK91701.1 hypothetical protein [Aliivibrio fischeri]